MKLFDDRLLRHWDCEHYEVLLIVLVFSVMDFLSQYSFITVLIIDQTLFYPSIVRLPHSRNHSGNQIDISFLFYAFLNVRNSFNEFSSRLLLSQNDGDLLKVNTAIKDNVEYDIRFNCSGFIVTLFDVVIHGEFLSFQFSCSKSDIK